MVDTIKVATVNCQGCLQDTHFTYEIEATAEIQWGYKCLFNSYTSNSRGVAIFLNNYFELKLHNGKKVATVIF